MKIQAADTEILDAHAVPMFFSRSGWIVGLERDRKGQIPAGSERGQHPQHFTLHLLDSVSGSAFLSCVLPSPLFPLIQFLIFLCANLNLLLALKVTPPAPLLKFHKPILVVSS